jgi:heme exporter protein D
VEFFQAKAFIDAVRKVAWSMPAPNAYAAELMSLCTEAEQAMTKHQAQLFAIVRQQTREARQRRPFVQTADHHYP